MSDSSARLHQMLIFGSEFDIESLRNLCGEITRGMVDQAEAARLAEMVVSEAQALALAVQMEQPALIVRGFRDDALEAANRMIREALG